MKKILFLSSMLFMATAAYGQTYFFDDFDDGNISDWTQYDEDGDTNIWEPVQLTGLSGALTSYSYDNIALIPLTPNNYLVSPAINLTSATNPILTYKIKGQDPDYAGEKYSVYVATTNTVAAFLTAGPVLTEVASANGPGGVYYTKSIDLTAYAGEAQIYIAFRHYDSVDLFALHLDDVKVAAPATAAPACATLTSPTDGATGVSYLEPLVITWTPSTTGASADSYDVYLGTTPTPTTLAGTASGTTFSATGLSASTTYYWTVIPKNTAGSATGCSVFSFTTADNPFAPYCGPLDISFTTEPITRVKFAGIDNVSAAETAGGIGHENYTTIVGNVNQGGTYEMTLEGNTSGNYDNRFVVFIDWNQNGVLDDAGEVYAITTLLNNSTGTDGKQIMQDLAVPADALLGSTRMRVKKIFGNSNFLNPCSGASFGQVEDYTISVGGLAVSNANKAQVKVYPNPVVDVLNVDAASKVSAVDVFDLTGKRVSAHQLNSVKNQINLSNLAPGVYVVNIETESGIQSVKIIKK